MLNILKTHMIPFFLISIYAIEMLSLITITYASHLKSPQMHIVTPPH